ncbi:MAG TPA: hypothetical protein VGM84_02790 [Steroidobacteraceae bacterium]|jgi:hypothetical protein
MRLPTASVAAIVAAVLAAGLGTQAAGAAGDKTFAVSPEAAGALKACIGENDDARRLTCYDKALSRAPGHVVPSANTTPEARTAPAASTPAEPVQPAQASQPVQAKTTPEQRFGLSAGQVVRKENIAESPKQVTAQVTSIGRESNGGLKLTLDNGQLWVQQTADGQELAIRVGDSVTVSHELMGGFLLTSPGSGHRSMRVRRIQ